MAHRMGSFLFSLSVVALLVVAVLATPTQYLEQHSQNELREIPSTSEASQEPALPEIDPAEGKFILF